MLTSAKRQQSSLMLQGTEQLHLGGEGSSMRSCIEIAILTFKGQRCPKRGGQKQDISLNGPGLDPAEQI